MWECIIIIGVGGGVRAGGGLAIVMPDNNYQSSQLCPSIVMTHNVYALSLLCGRIVMFHNSYPS